VERKGLVEDKQGGGDKLARKERIPIKNSVALWMTVSRILDLSHSFLECSGGFKYCLSSLTKHTNKERGIKFIA